MVRVKTPDKLAVQEVGLSEGHIMIFFLRNEDMSLGPSEMMIFFFNKTALGSSHGVEADNLSRVHDRGTAGTARLANCRIASGLGEAC